MNFEAIQGIYGSLLVGATAVLGTLLPITEPPAPTVPIPEDVLVASANLSTSPQDPSTPEISFKLTTDTLLTNKVEGDEIKQVGQVEEVTINSEEVVGVIEVYGPAVSEVIPEPTPTPVKEKQTEKAVESQAAASPSPIASTTSIPTPSPSATPVTPSNPNSLNAELIFQMINNHRVSIGKPPYEKEERLCKIAQDRVPQLQNEIFGSGIMHAGLKAMNLPFWNTENIGGFQTEKQTYDWWMSDYIHRVAIESDHKYSCGACLGNTCAQEFSSFVPKG